MARIRRFGRFAVTAVPLTVLWAIICPFAFSGSTLQVMLLAMMGGWLACFWLGCIAAGWIPVPPPQPVRPRQMSHWEEQERAYREHQRHLWEQSRAAYLQNSADQHNQQQPPPPNDYWRP